MGKATHMSHKRPDLEQEMCQNRGPGAFAQRTSWDAKGTPNYASGSGKKHPQRLSYG